MTIKSPILDHIVILVTHDTLLDLSDRLENQFVVAPGGNHADGLTTNKLILLPDGVYIELIAFFDNIDPEKRKTHRWGNLKEAAIIDWALTLPEENDFRPIQQRVKEADVGASLTDLVAGGRTKEDGTILKWSISQGIDAQGKAIFPGRLPFWCLDRTPRELRVPYQVEPHLTQHPSRVSGVSSVSVHVPTAELQTLKGAYNAVFGLDGEVWPYEVPSGSTAGRRTISLSGTEGESVIRLVLNGPSGGQVELLPGLVIDIVN